MRVNSMSKGKSLFNMDEIIKETYERRIAEENRVLSPEEKAFQKQMKKVTEYVRTLPKPNLKMDE